MQCPRGARGRSGHENLSRGTPAWPPGYDLPRGIIRIARTNDKSSQSQFQPFASLDASVPAPHFLVKMLVESESSRILLPSFPRMVEAMDRLTKEAKL